MFSSDGAGLACTRADFTHNKYRKDDRRNGDQNEKPSSGSTRFTLLILPGLIIAQVYFGKTRDIVYDLRSVDDLEKARRQKELQKELVGFIKR